MHLIFYLILFIALHCVHILYSTVVLIMMMLTHDIIHIDTTVLSFLSTTIASQYPYQPHL